MRRKLFFCTLLFILVVVILTNLAMKYESDNIEYEENRYHYGTIKSIEATDKNISLVVKMDNGNYALLRCYNNNFLTQKDYGSKIGFKGIFEKPKGQRNPNCFDHKLYLKSKGIIYIVNVENLKICSEPSCLYQKYCKFLLTKKTDFLDSIKNINTKSFIEGLLFGNSGNLDEDIYNEFRKNGTTHILAVSGLHIGIITNSLDRILGKKQHGVNLIIVIFFLVSLCILCGWTPSVIRASGMIILKKYALYRDLRYDSLTALSVVSLLMIIRNPYIIYNPSFQMSFLAALSIIFIIPHIPKKIPDFLAVIIAVNVGLLPYQTYQFNNFSVTSIVANIFVVYIAGILLPVVFVQFVIFIITGISISIFSNALSEFLIEINKICTFNTEMIKAVSPTIELLIAIYLIGAFVLSEFCYLLLSRKKKKSIYVYVSTILLISILTTIAFPNKFKEAEIVFVDIGQGDCVHIKAEDVNILIDGGGSTNYQVGKNTLMPYLLKNGVSEIDLAIATHMHTDHYIGLKELKDEGMIEKIEVGLVAGKTYRISEDIIIDTIWPIERPKDDITQDENKNCSVFIINYNGKKIMITGDLDEEGERRMLEYYKGTDLLKADILAIGHHGSRYSTSTEFLKEVSPKYGVIQVGKNNYGHPHVKTIEKCEEKCIILLRNDIHGAIGFSLEEDYIEYCTMF